MRCVQRLCVILIVAMFMLSAVSAETDFYGFGEKQAEPTIPKDSLTDDDYDPDTDPDLEEFDKFMEGLEEQEQGGAAGQGDGDDGLGDGGEGGTPTPDAGATDASGIQKDPNCPECDPIYDMLELARAELQELKDAIEEAELAIKHYMEELQDFEEPSSSASSGGTTLTSSDLKVRDWARQHVWQQYQDGDLTAQQVEDFWENIDNEDLSEYEDAYRDDIQADIDEWTDYKKELMDYLETYTETVEEWEHAYADCLDKCKKGEKVDMGVYGLGGNWFGDMMEALGGIFGGGGEEEEEPAEPDKPEGPDKPAEGPQVGEGEAESPPETEGSSECPECDPIKALLELAQWEYDQLKADEAEAELAIRDYMNELQDFEEPSSSASSGGRTLTSTDLKVRDWARAHAWEKYQNGDLTAQEVEDFWENIDNEDLSEYEDMYRDDIQADIDEWTEWLKNIQDQLEPAYDAVQEWDAAYKDCLEKCKKGEKVDMGVYGFDVGFFDGFINWIGEMFGGGTTSEDDDPEGTETELDDDGAPNDEDYDPETDPDMEEFDEWVEELEEREADDSDAVPTEPEDSSLTGDDYDPETDPDLDDLDEFVEELEEQEGCQGSTDIKDVCESTCDVGNCEFASTADNGDKCYSCVEPECPDGTFDSESACESSCELGDCEWEKEDGKKCWSCEKNCFKVCDNLEMSYDPFDHTDSIEDQLEGYECVSSVTIQLPNNVQTDDCFCHGTQAPSMTFDETTPDCTGTACGDVPCNEEVSCQVGDDLVTVSCVWGGWDKLDQYLYQASVGVAG